MIQSAAVRLTMMYLLVIMVLSIGFSVAIYRISSHELDRGLPLNGAIINLLGQNTFNLEELRAQQAQESKDNLRNNLLLLNLATLVMGAAVSWVLAQQTLRPIEEALEAQGRFTSDASHELRTPLTAMRTSIEVGLRDPKLTLPKAKGLLDSTLEEVKKLSSLSSGLLKLTRDNGGDIVKEPVSLKAVADAAVLQLDMTAKQKSITLHNEAKNLTVLGDAISLQEVVSIIVENAIKYSNEKTAITIKSRASGRSALLTVSDQGPGIKALDLVHIFDRFYRADTSRTRGKTEGYGLGLPIAKSIVEAHGGSIEARSVLGEGSVFTVKLPLAPTVSVSP